MPIILATWEVAIGRIRRPAQEKGSSDIISTNKKLDVGSVNGRTTVQTSLGINSEILFEK
jgi:hypothetical protein